MSKLSQKNKSQANCLTSSRTISRWQISLYIRLLYSLIGLDFTELENCCGAVVVAQLVERSVLIPEVRGSNPVIGKI